MQLIAIRSYPAYSKENPLKTFFFDKLDFAKKFVKMTRHFT